MFVRKNNVHRFSSDGKTVTIEMVATGVKVRFPANQIRDVVARLEAAGRQADRLAERRRLANLRKDESMG